MRLREYIQTEIDTHKSKIDSLTKLLYNIPLEIDGRGIGELEADSISIYGGWLILRDKSHKDLGAKLATITNQSPHFKLVGSTRTAIFRNVGPFYKVDLDRPNPKCRKIRALQLPKEVTLEICGDLPVGFELLEELE